MQNKYILLWLMCLLCGKLLIAQTTALPLWAKENWLLDRLEIKSQKNNDLNLSTVKPFLNGSVVAVADSFANLLVKGQNPAHLSRIDQYNLLRFRANYKEYANFKAADSILIASKQPWGRHFYATPAHFYEVNAPKFYININPTLLLQQGKESSFKDPVYVYGKGLTGRGLFRNAIGFQFFVTHMQEQGPYAFRQRVAETGSVPGAARWKMAANGNGVSYWDARGSISWKVTPYIHMQLGYDQQFIGNGYRSLLLSNFSGNHLFFKINTRIWKINYTNLFMQLEPTANVMANARLQKKYASMHHFGINLSKWLEIGFFEGVIFGRQNRYDFSYLQPMIFLRSIEQQNGSPDNANIGIDFKMNLAKKFQLYGQIMLDEFKKDEVIGAKKNWWGNKQGFQLGGKYVDAFGIANLDVQAEVNQIRPFMYSFRDTTGAYTHALQPLSHPLGSNVREWTGIIRYQPALKWYVIAKVSYWKQGLDSAGYNFGSNPNLLYQWVGAGGSRLRDSYYPMFSGMPAKAVNANVSISWECKENLFIELNGQIRQYKPFAKDNIQSNQFTLGFRWNMYARSYEY